jgi:AcrR family transcriptional regulator
MRALTIGELERESGVSRQTIYYYVRTGLLPAAQKASRSRALYTEEHLALLREIEDLRAQGYRRSAIQARLAVRIREIADSQVDLVARRDEELRQSILVAATRSFVGKGYKGTRMADLIEDLGITPQVLYGYFATKQDLFIACYKIAVRFINRHIGPRYDQTDDPAERQIWGMYADSGIKAFAPSLMMLAHGAAQHDEQARRDLREAYGLITEDIISDLRRLRRADDQPPLNDELVTHAIIGSFEQMWARASLDDEFSWREIVRTNLAIFLAIAAVYTGELDISERLARYGQLLDEVSQLEPPVPAELAQAAPVPAQPARSSPPVPAEPNRSSPPVPAEPNRSSPPVPSGRGR